MLHCDKCGSPLAEDVTVCGHCGSPVQAAPAAIPEPEPPSVTVLIEPGAGVWAPAPDAVGASEGDTAAPSEAGPTTPPAFVPTAVAARVPAPSVQYAGFWRRFIAFWLDIFVFGSIELFVAYARGIPLNTQQPADPIQAAKGLLISAFIYWLYWAILESSPWQATIGKRAMDIYVTDLQGRRLSFAKATGRYFGKTISFLILLMGFFMIAFTERKQALHDMMAGCLVVRRQE